MKNDQIVSDEQKKKILGDRYDQDKDSIDWNYFTFKEKLKELENTTDC